ncbi:hypothetical protein [Paludibaculum fermentans]|uniref:Uncharacterized protein n=1 Tax=Paludibaculum fermentans TaxID=1473598 RepID=A0A7S7SMP6_PALFE|nr:hypothetical protein [Paludibaculum fermentans]QOY90654.1 hypothetical protein IRI77_12105 [Paludibaculum fermentans]
MKSAAELKNPLPELEFGRELVHFRHKGAAPKEGPVLQGKSTIAFMVQVGDSQLFLFTIGTPERPWVVARQRGDKREVFWYGTYEELPFEPKLFAKPEGVKIEEARQ